MTFYFFIADPQPTPVCVPLSLCSTYDADYQGDSGRLYFSEDLNPIEISKVIERSGRSFSVLTGDDVGERVRVYLDTLKEPK